MKRFLPKWGRILAFVILSTTTTTFSTGVSAQPCGEALVYFTASTAADAPAELVARTLCNDSDEAAPLAGVFREQNVTLDAWSAATNVAAYGFGSISIVSDLDPAPRVILAETEAAFYHNPVWSPDGTRLVAIETAQDGNTERLVVTDLHGSTRPIAPVVTDPETEALIVPLAWSPDGQWLSYTLSRRLDDERWDANILLLSTACIDDPAQACTAHPLAITDGSGERPMLTLEGWEDVPEHWFGAVWSPDGARLAFLCGDHLCFLNADGSGYTRSADPFTGHSLAWSPSGRFLAYYADNDIYVYDVVENVPVNVTQSPDVPEFLPGWITLPDGAYLFAFEMG